MFISCHAVNVHTSKCIACHAVNAHTSKCIACHAVNAHTSNTRSFLFSVLQELILAVPPFEAAHQGPVLAMPDFEELRAFVDFFSLMTYDASSPSKPGPNAPWKWVKSNAHAVASTAINRYGNRCCLQSECRADLSAFCCSAGPQDLSVSLSGKVLA